jgi:DNA-binding Lrp family transcriptional regulator
MLTDEMRYRLMRLLQGNPQLSQRAAASQLEISVGKVNFCVRALARQGLIKARRTRCCARR